eukprot:TRINITY_DN63246_c0_g1_i1.p1 TRINITY_DN63246_c0_g1~~TRINITY_DN63246_c0_g1_i1.p1  ORF type:complete len:772 (+),score=156.27 TRINITY_DN63246_c0_g1_i1:85-2400(+)
MAPLLLAAVLSHACWRASATQLRKQQRGGEALEAWTAEAPAANASASPHYDLDDSHGFGLTWEGVGAISGGGATTKLLYDYPKDIQDKLLDLFFSPGQGLNLQMLKVEIGGDTDATEGAEPSHMHGAGDENYERGYEWWLMKEAKKRNPDIKLYGLPWGFSGAVDPQANSESTETRAFADVKRTANYTLSWLLGAKRVHGLDIDFVGQWNEKDSPADYAGVLRDAIAMNMVHSRPRVLAPQDHYVGSTNEPDPQGCAQHRDATPGELWADEEGSTFDGRSARCLARILNRNYISKCKTATFQWHLVSAFYSYLPWPRCGLAIANQPWSGAFEITSPLWAIAHTTQFAPIGWRYAAHGQGTQMLRNGGSMVTRVSPDLKHFSIVIEKMDPANSVCGHGVNPQQTVNGEEVVIKLKGSFGARAAKGLKLHVWRSNFAGSSSFGANPPDSEVFQRMEPMHVGSDGVIKLWVKPEEIFTITTLSSGGKPKLTSPPEKAFPIPYKQSFDSERLGAPARLWYDQMGAWEIQKSPYGDEATRGNVMRQVVPVFPACWGYMCEPPTTYLAPSSLSGDLTVAMDVRLEDYGGITLNPQGGNYSPLVLKSGRDGQPGSWQLGQRTGKLNFAPNKWHKITLRMHPNGWQTASVDGKFLRASMSLIEFQNNQDTCTENTFPLSTRGRRHLGMKPDPATTPESCRQACCRDENLCDVWQFDGEKCEIGRAAFSYEKDLTRRWIGGTRWPLSGWHLKVRLSRFMHASIDNVTIFDSQTKKVQDTR